MKKQAGNISTEWVFLTAIMTIALFAPIPGQDQSIVGVMMESIRGFYANFSFLISLP